MKVEVLVADHLNKPDVGATVARQWFRPRQRRSDRRGGEFWRGTRGCRRRQGKETRSTSIPAPATSDLTGTACNANTIHWVYDTYMLAKSTGGAMVKAGGDSWFFITADYAFGKALQRDTTEFVQSAGGKVVGSVAYPFPGTSDFSSYLLQAQTSGAKVLGIANAGADTINTIKQGQGVRHQAAARRTAVVSDRHPFSRPGDRAGDRADG